MRPCAWEGEGTRLKPPPSFPQRREPRPATLATMPDGQSVWIPAFARMTAGKAPEGPAPSPQFSTIVTARRFSAQAASSDPCATGRSDP